jgi:polysaccharide export outer membrane protein
MKIASVFRFFCLAATLAFAAGGLTGCQTATNTPPTASEEPQNIVLRAGDAIKVSFPGSPNLDTAQPIRRDGKIVMPLVGEVEAAGLTPDALQTNLVKLIGPQIGSKQVVVTVESSSFPVYVTGAVIHSGKINSDHPITALEAVMEAGGFDYNTADMKHVKVNRTENGETKIYILNLKDALEVGKKKPFYLKPNDIIFIPQRLQVF